jgi:hypothetical protein
MIRSASSPSHPSPPDAIRGRCRPSLLLSVLLIDPYLSPDEPAAGAMPEATEGCPSDKPEGVYLARVDEGPDGTTGSVGCSKIFRADMRDEVGVFRVGADFFGVRSSSVGLSNTLANGDPLTGVDWGVAGTGDLMVKIASATSAAGVETALIVSTVLIVSTGRPDAAAFASLLLSALAFALASLSSVA